MGDRRLNPGELEKDTIRYVRRIAYVFWQRNPWVDYKELISEGHVGAAIAAEKYDPTRGVPFLSYAMHWIAAKIRDYIRKSIRPCGVIGTYHGEIPRAYCYDETDSDAEDNPILLAPAEQRLATSYSDETEDQLIAHDDAEWVTRRVLCLPRREQLIIIGRFWEERTLEDIGEEIGLSKERIRQLEVRALRLLREVEDREVKKLSANVVIETIRALRDGKSITKAAEILGTNEPVIRYRIAHNKGIEEAAIHYAGFKPRKKKEQAPAPAPPPPRKETPAPELQEKSEPPKTESQAGITEEASLAEKSEHEKGGALDDKPLSFKGAPTPADEISLSEEDFRKLCGQHFGLPTPMVKITIEIMCPMEKLPEIMKVVNQ